MSRFAPPLVPGLLLVFATAGCADGGESGLVAVRDSAGVEIVLNQPGSIDAAAEWRLSGPVMEAGAGASPEVPLHEVSDIAVLPDGRVAVATTSPARVVILGSDGKLTTTLGRAGEGPGEFLRPASVVSLGGDSVAVWDPDRRRLSVFLGDGTLVRDSDLGAVAPLSAMAAPTTETPAAFTRLLPGAGGSLVVFARGVFGPATGARRPEAASHRVTSAGERLATFGPFPGYESYNSPTTGPAPYPFGADTYAAASGEALVVGTAEDPELRWYGPSGQLERIVRWPDRERAAEGPLVDQWEASLDSWMAEMPPARAERLRDTFDRIPRPDRFPAYAGLIAGEDGRVWVADYAGQLSVPATPIDHRVPARRWLIFGADGVLAAKIETPAGFQPHAVHDGMVWGVYRDEMDVESARGYGVHR